MKTNDIITYTQKGVELIYDSKINDILKDVNYTPILIALRERPMTVKDLEEKYNEIALKEIEKIELSTKEKEKLKKKVIRKDKTLYRYLKYLIKSDLVVIAGRRVTEGQTASETLYGRKAEIYYYVERPNEFWKSEKCVKIVNKVVEMLRLKDTNIDYDCECLKSLFEKIDEVVYSENAKFFENKSSEISEIIQDNSFDETDRILSHFNLVNILLKAEDYLQELKNCEKK